MLACATYLGSLRLRVEAPAELPELPEGRAREAYFTARIEALLPVPP